MNQNILEFIQENKKKFKENCFENVISDLKENPMCPPNYFKKSAKTKKIKTKNHENVLNLWWVLGTKLVLLVNF